MANDQGRIDDTDLRVTAHKRAGTVALKSTGATPGVYRAQRPLEIMQIDHTMVDIIVVDEQTREPLGRPWITTAFDVFTRMVTGFYLLLVCDRAAFRAPCLDARSALLPLPLGTASQRDDHCLVLLQAPERMPRRL